MEVVIAVNASSAWIWIGGVAISAIGATGISTNTHTSAHFATSDYRWLNLFMAWIGYPILGQFSISYWWKKHNTGHHRVPNVIGVDKDCDFMPLFAYCEADVAGKGPPRGCITSTKARSCRSWFCCTDSTFKPTIGGTWLRVLRDPQQRRLSIGWTSSA